VVKRLTSSTRNRCPVIVGRMVIDKRTYPPWTSPLEAHIVPPKKIWLLATDVELGDTHGAFVVPIVFRRWH
jgi:hypothetical protein